MWREVGAFFTSLNDNLSTRVVVLSGAGKIFTAGLDLGDAGQMLMPSQSKKPSEANNKDNLNSSHQSAPSSSSSSDPSRRALFLRKYITEFQAAFTAIEKCPQPVIAAVHSACIGGGVDLVSACDIRLCSADAAFSIKEVDVGLAADIGTLQRCSKIMGNHSLLRELCYTGRRLKADEAMRCGFVSSVFEDKEKLLQGAMKLAEQISRKSPVAVLGTKHNLNYARDHSVDNGLNYVATWNMAMLQTSDIPEAITSAMQKRAPLFAKL